MNWGLCIRNLSVNYLSPKPVRHLWNFEVHLIEKGKPCTITKSESRLPAQTLRSGVAQPVFRRKGRGNSGLTYRSLQGESIGVLDFQQLFKRNVAYSIVVQKKCFLIFKNDFLEVKKFIFSLQAIEQTADETVHLPFVEEEN